MKNLILLLLILSITVILFNCSEDNVITNQNSNQPLTVTGKIENWYYGSDKILIAKIQMADSPFTSINIDTSQITTDGRFTITLTTPGNEYLTTTNFDDSSCTQHITVNPSNTKWGGVSFAVYLNDSLLGHASLRSDTVILTHTGQSYCEYQYADKSGSIMGKDTCIESSLGNMIILMDYNLTYISGWNMVYMKINEYNFNIPKLDYTISNLAQPVKWYYFRASIWNDKKNLLKKFTGD